MQNRIVGIEQEFATRPVDLNDDLVAELLGGIGIKLGHTGFADNGFRIYLDGTHLEISTPEAFNPFDAVAAYFASLRIAGALYGTQATAHGRKSEALWLENLTRDIPGNTWGHHENYQSELNRSEREIAEILGSVLVSRFAFSPGWIYLDKEGEIQIRRSQRTHALRRLNSADTTNNRPLVNTREHPVRFHNINDGACMIPKTHFIRMNMMYDFLTLVERGEVLDHLLLENLVSQAMKVGGDDPDVDTVLFLKRDAGDKEKTMKLSEHIMAIEETILDRIDTELSEQARAAHEEGYKMGEQLGRAQPLTKEMVAEGIGHPWVGQVDANTKKVLMLKRTVRMEKQNREDEAYEAVAVSDKKLITVKGSLDLNEQWHTMNPEANIAYKLQESGVYPDTTGILERAEEIFAGDLPSNTSKRRADFVADHAHEYRRDEQAMIVDWDYAEVAKALGIENLADYGTVSGSDDERYLLTF